MNFKYYGAARADFEQKAEPMMLYGARFARWDLKDLNPIADREAPGPFRVFYLDENTLSVDADGRRYRTGGFEGLYFEDHNGNAIAYVERLCSTIYID